MIFLSALRIWCLTFWWFLCRPSPAERDLNSLRNNEWVLLRNVAVWSAASNEPSLLFSSLLFSSLLFSSLLFSSLLFSSLLFSSLVLQKMCVLQKTPMMSITWTDKRQLTVYHSQTNIGKVAPVWRMLPHKRISYQDIYQAEQSAYIGIVQIAGGIGQECLAVTSFRMVTIFLFLQVLALCLGRGTLCQPLSRQHFILTYALPITPQQQGILAFLLIIHQMSYRFHRKFNMFFVKPGIHYMKMWTRKAISVTARQSTYFAELLPWTKERSVVHCKVHFCSR